MVRKCTTPMRTPVTFSKVPLSEGGPQHIASSCACGDAAKDHASERRRGTSRSTTHLAFHTHLSMTPLSALLFGCAQGVCENSKTHPCALTLERNAAWKAFRVTRPASWPLPAPTAGSSDPWPWGCRRRRWRDSCSAGRRRPTLPSRPSGACAGGP